jgi:thymidine phosphorylase
VSSLPLICGSILSKKLAEGLDALVLDIKVGNGAIFKEASAAEELATHLIRTAAAFNLRTIALLTDMSQPLGAAVGNWVEVREAIELLNGEGPEDTRKVTLVLGALMLQAAGKTKDLPSGMHQLSALLDNGAAWKKFLKIVQAQEGDITFLENPDKYPAPKHRRQINAEADGYVTAINAREFAGSACCWRRRKWLTTPSIIPRACYCTKGRRTGSSGDPLVTLQTQDRS